MLGRVLKRLWTLSLVNIVSALSSLTLFIASMMNAEGNFELWQIEEESIMWIVFYAFKSKILCYLRRHGVLTQRSYYLVLTLRCVKSVRICRFSGSHFPAFALIRRIRTLVTHAVLLFISMTLSTFKSRFQFIILCNVSNYDNDRLLTFTTFIVVHVQNKETRKQTNKQKQKAK